MIKVKKILSVAALLLVAALVFSGCSNGKATDPTAPEGMKLASGYEADYLMYVPSGWIVDKSTLYTSAYFSTGDTTSISTTAYGMSFTANSVEDWWNGYKEEFEKTFDSFEMISSDTAKLGEIDGMKYTYTAKLADKQYNYICTAVVKGNYIYYMLYTSTPEYYENHLEALDDVVNNFSFK